MVIAHFPETKDKKKIAGWQKSKGRKYDGQGEGTYQKFGITYFLGFIPTR